MLPTRKLAEQILDSSEKLNPGKWADHSRVAATCAEKIAVQDKELDAEKAYILGLLHDVGRKFGVSYFGHIVDGYNYMIELGYDEVARICLTHSFPVKDIRTYLGNFDVSAEVINEMSKKLQETNYDDYDRLIQLCDCLALPDGVVSMKERINDIASRYGHYPDNIRKANFKLKEYFEERLRRNIYEVASDKVELWGL